MYDSGKIIPGIIIFFCLITFPVWYNLASGKAAPFEEPKIITDAKECVESKEYMRHSHMDLLNQWRDAVVREDKRVYVSQGGKEYMMSLSNTCMDCHSNKTDFCDQCHNYMEVRPYCWDCHIEPEENL
ncbi:MAG: sulfate reduction electron transfer complex DsrMKJOP subunit DsrJ [bacterium]